MSGPNLANKVNQHADVLRKMSMYLRNIDQRLAFLEVKVDHQIQATKSGNDTRGIIMILVAVKVLFDGFSSIDWNLVTKLIGHGG